ncbi:MAG: tape measure protein [Pseudomonadota bacterium]|nr:tape measure protein [Pseudomonadota bacterium]
MATAKLELLADSSQIRRADRDLENLGRQGGVTEKATRSLARAFALLGTAISVRQIQQAADAYKSMQNQLRIVTNDTENLLGVTQALNQVAQDSRADIEATVGLYSKLARSTSELGLSQGELVRITETINKSFAVSGATAEEANNAITQLAQGLASGALRGDEFNSVAEQAPGILRAVSQETGLAVGELRDFAAEGKITTDLLVSALQNYSSQVDTEFASANTTISQAATQLQNDFIDLIGAFDDATGASGEMSGALVGITEAMQTLADYIRADAIRGPFNAQFEGVIGDVNSFVNVVGTEFNQFFNGVSAAADETGLRLGDAFLNIVPNIRAAIQLATVEIASFFDTVSAYSKGIAQSLNPFDDVSVQDAINNFEDARDVIDAARMAALSDIVDQNKAEVERTRITIEQSENRVEQYRKEREARILALGGIENTGGIPSDEPRKPKVNRGVDEDDFEKLKQKIILQQQALELTSNEYELRRNLLALGDGANQSQIDEITALTEQMQALRFEAELVGASLENSMQNIGLNALDSLSQGLANAITEGESLRDVIGGIANSILNELLTAIIRYAIGSAAQALIGQTTATTAAVTSATTIAAAATPAAIAMNIATLGGAATAAAASSAAAIPTMTGLIASSGIAGFEKGGYTGNYGTKEVAGVVHGQEFVMNARATRQNRGALEAMNRGESVGGNTYVNVVNNATNSNVSAEERQDAQGNRVIDIVVANINQRGKIHKAMTQTTTASNRI